jgi:hypothetical protein
MVMLLIGLGLGYALSLWLLWRHRPSGEPPEKPGGHGPAEPPLRGARSSGGMR